MKAIFGLLLGALTMASAQTGWSAYTSQEDRFTVAIPAAPQIEAFTYTTEYASKLRARRYTATDGKTNCIMTVVDMSTTDRAPNGHAIEIRGSIQFAATNLRRTGTVTADHYSELSGVPGQVLQITLPGGVRKYAGIYVLNKRLYIMEATTPAGVTAPPLLYLSSLIFRDEKGMGLRFMDNNYSFPDGRPPPVDAEAGQ